MQRRLRNSGEEKELKIDKLGIPRKLKEAAKKKKYISGRLEKRTKGGYTINVDGFMAFCPNSEMYPHPLSESEHKKLKKKAHKFVVIQIKKRSLVISRKRVVRYETWKHINNAYSLKYIIKGTVKEIKPYGVFVDLGGIDGLLHINEISDSRINDIHAFFKKGQIINVIVLDIDEVTGQVSLSLRPKIVINDRIPSRNRQ